MEGFTEFCKQVDPQHTVPLFLNDFLNWLFDRIKKSIMMAKIETEVALWAELPFFSKFIGDGVLFLWNINRRKISTKFKNKKEEAYQENKGYKMEQALACNIVRNLDIICESYREFVTSELSKKYANPPPKLRCGIARGSVFSIGGGRDYVGPCINIASRLQKLHGLGFCFQKRGFDIETGMRTSKNDYTLKKVEIKGIGANELVYIRKKDFEELDEKDKKYFKNP